MLRFLQRLGPTTVSQINHIAWKPLPSVYEHLSCCELPDSRTAGGEMDSVFMSLMLGAHAQPRLIESEDEDAVHPGANSQYALSC